MGIVDIRLCIANLIAARAEMASADRRTTFSKWYKGDHAKARSAVGKALKELIKALEKAPPARPHAALLVAVKEFRDGFVSKSGTFGLGMPIKSWTDTYRDGWDL